MVLAGNLSIGFHPRRGDGAFLWPQRLCRGRRLCPIQSGGGLVAMAALRLHQVPQIPVDTGVRLPPHSKMSGGTLP